MQDRAGSELLLEIALRGGATALLLLMGAILLRDARRTDSGPVGGLLALSFAAYVVESAPGDICWQVPWLRPLAFVSMAAPALLWIWTGVVFDDEFRLSWRDGAAWLTLPVLGALQSFADQRWAFWAREVLALLFVALGVWRILAGWREDLIERRRRLRFVLAIAVSLYAARILGSELLDRGGAAAASTGIGNTVALAALVFVLAFASLTGGRTFTARIALATPAEAAPEDMPAAAPPAASHDPELLARLRRLLEEDRVYREEGLSIGGLAGRLDVPERRLRQLINQHLGHRNFSSFINGYRLDDAAGALADPGQAEVPILTIALDAGFQSIGPFNRAFKARAGVTPSEYRRLAESGIGKAIPRFGKAQAEFGETR